MLPKWQRKLGAPKSTEAFDDLYARARALERHDQQFNARSSSTKPQSFSQKPQTTTTQTGREQNQEGNSSRNQKRSAGPNKPRGKRCWHCYEYGHFVKDCPKIGTESPGKSTRSKISTLATSDVREMSIQQLEEVLASKRLAAEQNILSSKVETVTGVASSSNQVTNSDTSTDELKDAIGPVLYLDITVEGHPVKALVDTGAQSTILSQNTLHEIARHMKSRALGLPQLEKPCEQLYGRAGANSSVITITAQTKN